MLLITVNEHNLIAARCHAFAIHFYRHGSAANIHEQVKF